MKDRFVRVAAVTPEIAVADPAANATEIARWMEECAKQDVKVAVFPELCLSGYTCGDLFLQSSLIWGVEEALSWLLRVSANYDCLFFVGLPWTVNGKLYNCVAALFEGRLVGVVPKKQIPNHGEFSEGRYFAPAFEKTIEVSFPNVLGDPYSVPVGTNLLFTCDNLYGLTIGVQIGEALWGVKSQDEDLIQAGATVILNAAADIETTGKADYRRDLVRLQSAKGVCGYVFANAGEGESTTDLVFSGHNVIAENGRVLAESARFATGITVTEIDLDRIDGDRRRKSTFDAVETDRYTYIPFGYYFLPELELTRTIEPSPFVPKEEEARKKRCEEIVQIQAMGLKTRMKKIGAKKAVVGVSGGLDSTLALLITARAFDLLGLPRNGILAVTMPCFGTTDRTYNNACVMAETLGCELREVNIKAAVKQHFRDIGHELNDLSVTFENAQARERTQVLMDLANKIGGLVIGTGDLSELALGWATYNGDHMSMYGVNGAIPKTLVRHLVIYFADTCGEAELSRVLYDVLDTPVSPELLPPKDGKIAQKTEDLVGPYELHDFFMYYILRFGYTPRKIFRLAKVAFAGEYDEATIYKWLYTFYRRFFNQQFKRSCLPDGPKVGSVGVSPRGDLKMPSDASSQLWLKELEEVRPIG